MLVNKSHFSPESLINGSTPRSRNSSGILPLPLGISPIVTIESSTLYLHELHDHNTRRKIISNYKYQSVTKSHKRLQDIAIDDEVLIRFHPERFPLETLRKLHTQRCGPYKILKRVGSSAYELDIFHDLGISPVFCVEDLTHYRTFTIPQRFPVRPLQPSLLRRPAIEELLSLSRFNFINHVAAIRQWQIFQSRGELMGIISSLFS